MERLSIDVGENKVLIVPICLNILIKNLPVKLCHFHDIRFRYNFGEKELLLSVKYVNSVYAVSNTIFMNRSNMDIIEDLGHANMYCITTVRQKFSTGIGITNPIHLHAYIAQKYAIIKISPEYSEADKSHSGNLVEQLPLIRTIVYHSAHNNTHYSNYSYLMDSSTSKSFTPREIASIHTGRNCILYELPCDPTRSVKGWIDRAVKENTDGIEAMMKNKKSDMCNTQCIDMNKAGADIKSMSQSKEYYDITIHLEPSSIPAKIDVYVYKNNKLVLWDGMAGLY
jgi:hypothetical protein